MVTMTRPAQTGKIDPRLIEEANAVDLFALAQTRTLLHQVSSQEWAGPCPRCGGTKRFKVNPRTNKFFCRDCRPAEEYGWGDTTAYTMWLDGYDFREAVARLTNGSMPTAQPRQAEPQPRQRAAQPEQWHRQAHQDYQQAVLRLWEPEGKEGQDYLLGRGLEPHAWQAFGLGFKPDVFVPGTESAPQYAPAIAIPWFHKGRLVAIRYRFLKVQNGRKQSSRKGSNFTGSLFGGQALMGCAERFRVLIIVEGEFNAISIWQACYETGVDVLSIGSQSATLPAKLIEYAKRYSCVFIFVDEESAAKRLMALIPNAIGIQSPKDKHFPKGRDANDMLQRLQLGMFLAGLRERHAKNDEEREALLWDLYDAAMLPNGITTGEAKILRRIATKLGKKAEIYQPDASHDRWITPYIPHT